MFTKCYLCFQIEHPPSAFQGARNMKKKILITFLIILLFLEGIWFEKLLPPTNDFLTNWFLNSSIDWIRQLTMFFHQKLPVFAENLVIFVIAFFHLLMTVLCLKIYFSWRLITFFQIFFTCYFIFFCFSCVLIYAYIAQVRFFQVWEDFKGLFFSPFPLIFMFLICKLVKKQSSNSII